MSQNRVVFLKETAFDPRKCSAGGLKFSGKGYPAIEASGSSEILVKTGHLHGTASASPGFFRDQLMHFDGRNALM